MVALAEPKSWSNKTEKTSSLPRSHPRSLKTPYPRSTYATSGLRFYFSETGRWISRDPIGEWGGLNLYRAFDNDAVGDYDYLGFVCPKDEKSSFNVKTLLEAGTWRDRGVGEDWLGYTSLGGFGDKGNSPLRLRADCDDCCIEKKGEKNLGTIKKLDRHELNYCYLQLDVKSVIYKNTPDAKKGYGRDTIMRTLEFEGRWQGYFLHWHKVNDEKLLQVLTGCRT